MYVYDQRDKNLSFVLNSLLNKKAQILFAVPSIDVS